MQYASRYKLKETDSFAKLTLVKRGWLRIRTFEVQRGGRFFIVVNGVFEPPEISLN